MSFGILFLLVYFSFSIISLSLSFFSNSKYVRSLSYIPFILTPVIFAYIAYRTIGPAWADYERMVLEMNEAQIYGFDYLIDGTYATHPLSAVILYLISQIGDFPLLKSLSAFIFLSAISVVCCKFIKYNYELIYIVFSWMICIPLFDIATLTLNNIRLPIALSVFLVAIVNMSFFKGSKVLNFVLMIIACLIHVSVWMVLVVYLLTFLEKRQNKLVVKIVCLLSGFAIVFSSRLFQRIIPALSYKINSYFIDDADISRASFTNAYALILVALTFIVCIFLQQNNKIKNIYIDFVINFVMLIIGIMPFSTIYYRFACIIPLFLLPLFILFLYMNHNSRVLYYSDYRYCYYIILLSFIVISLISVFYRYQYTYSASYYFFS